MEDLDQIEYYIENLIEYELLPEIRSKFIYQFTDEIKIDREGITLAETIFFGNNIPLIKFYTKSILDLNDQPRIKRIISHEIAHTFKANEQEANGHQDMNIWITKKQK